MIEKTDIRVFFNGVMQRTDIYAIYAGEIVFKEPPSVGVSVDIQAGFAMISYIGDGIIDTFSTLSAWGFP